MYGIYSRFLLIICKNRLRQRHLIIGVVIGENGLG